MVDIIVPMLQRIQAGVAGLESRLDETNAQLSAFKDMTEARFIGLEHAMLEISARSYRTEQRVAAIERRLDDPKR